MWFDRINRFYNTKNSKGERLWDIERVTIAVQLNKITDIEFKKITGEEYTE